MSTTSFQVNQSYESVDETDRHDTGRFLKST